MKSRDLSKNNPIFKYDDCVLELNLQETPKNYLLRGNFTTITYVDSVKDQNETFSISPHYRDWIYEFLYYFYRAFILSGECICQYTNILSLIFILNF